MVKAFKEKVIIIHTYFVVIQVLVKDVIIATK